MPSRPCKLRAYTRCVSAAAFFDLDRTLLRRSSALALAGSFREYGVIGRGQLAKAAAWQLLFAARGASAETVRKAAEDGLMVLKGFRVDDLRDLVAGAMEPILKPLVYQEPLKLVERHRERGEPVYIVSATLQEIVEEIARELGFDGALGSTCEIVDGVYTGRSLRGAHGDGKAAAIRELADAGGLRSRRIDRVLRQPHRSAVPRGGRESRRRQPGPAAAADRRRPGLADARVRRARLPARVAAAAGAAGDPARARRGRGGLGRAPACSLTSGSPRLGFSEADAATLAAHFLDAESRGKLGHGLARIDWLETLPDLEPDGAPGAPVTPSPATSAGTAHGALGYLTLAAICDAQLARAARACARRRRVELLPDRDARLVRRGASPRAASSPR